MTFDIRMGVPDMAEFYDDLVSRAKSGDLSGDEEELYRKLGKTLKFLRIDPRHNSLQTHEIEALSRRYDYKVFQSYVGQGEKALRLFWAYGPNRQEITILGLEPHPESGKSGAYARVRLSEMPKE